MNNYSRLEINLLPPELLPGPTVRYAMLINIMIIMLAVTFIGVSWYINWMALTVGKETRRQLEDQIQNKAFVEADYNRLASIGKSIERFGRLTMLASNDYVDMPVVLDRLARIIPDEVYLQRVTNGQTAGRGLPVSIGMLLTASDDDPALLVRTLQAFKNDPMFADSFMPEAGYEELTLDELMARNLITWTVSGAGMEKQVFAQQYQFEIHAVLNRPLNGIGLPLTHDVSGTYAWQDPLEQPQEAADAPEPVKGPGEAT